MIIVGGDGGSAIANKGLNFAFSTTTFYYSMTQQNPLKTPYYLLYRPNHTLKL